MKVLFSVIAFSCIIGLGHCLKCYEFSDESKLGEGVECPPEANACLKAVAEMYHTRAYARSCGVLEGGAEDGDCIIHNDDELWSGTREAEVCYCTTDLCNGTMRTTTSSYLALCLSAVILLFYKKFM